MTSHLKKRVLLIAVTMISLTGCSGRSNRLAQLESNRQIIDQFISAHQLVSKSSILSFRYHGWQLVDEQHLVIDSGPERYYLIRFRSICDDLRFTQGIIVKQQTSNLSAKFDRIRAVPEGNIDCHIDQIYPFSKAQVRVLKQLLKDAREPESV